MLIHEASKQGHTTKKAIGYYIEQGLLFPKVLENGYREFTKEDIERLKKIRVLRQLGIYTDDIKMVLGDTSGAVLQTLAIKKEIHIQRELLKKEIIDQLSCGVGYLEIEEELNTLESTASIADKLLEVFPDWYGRFIWLHFARFLNHPISTIEQKSAYNIIITVLDDMPKVAFTKELEEYMASITMELTNQQIVQMNVEVKKNMENIDHFLQKNEEQLNQYLLYKKSDQYKNSMCCQFKNIMKGFHTTSNYAEIFVPAMRALSSSYDEYVICSEKANKKLIAKYPDIEKYDL